LNRCVPFGVVRLVRLLLPVIATGFGQKRPVFGPNKGHFTLRIVAERQGFEPWDLVGLRFSRAHQSGRAGPSPFDLSVTASDLVPLRPPLFAGEDASEAASPDRSDWRSTAPIRAKTSRRCGSVSS
jgi:hypothetical protein